MREKFYYLFVILLVLLLTLFLYSNKVEPFESFSLRFNDSNFALQEKKIAENVVLVAIDEQSINSYGRWPWSRDILAKGIEKLAEADAVLLDMIFSEPTEKSKDQRLAYSIDSLQNSVCGFFLRNGATQSHSQYELDILNDSALDYLQSQISGNKNPHFLGADSAELNILPILESCTLSGSFSTSSESDNLFRSYPVAFYFQNILYPSLALQGLRLKHNSDIKRVDGTHLAIADHIIKVDEKGFVKLNFYTPPQYKIISFLDIIQGKIKREYFKDKIVILGITELGAGDIVSTPIGNIPGAFLHYTFISNFLQNQLIVELPYATIGLIILMAFVPFLSIIFFRSIVTRMFFNLSVYFIVYIIVHYLFRIYMFYIDLFYPLITLLTSIAAVEVLAFTLEEKKARFIKEAFSSYLSNDLLQQLIRHPKKLSLGGEQKEISILFSDIRGFTSISESMDPVSLVRLLNRYFTPMTNAVLKHGGMLDKYIGDAVMAFFNAPVDIKNHADAACHSALEMLEELEILNKKLKEEGEKRLCIGIGISTAEVIVGNMGSDIRFNYTVIGDGVNLTSRVEEMTKRYGVPILITEHTLEMLTDDFLYREIEPVQVKGKQNAVLLYHLMLKIQSSYALKVLYDQALKVYKDSDLLQAKVLFEDIVRKYDDGVSKYFLVAIEENRQWGVKRMFTK